MTKQKCDAYLRSMWKQRIDGTRSVNNDAQSQSYPYEFVQWTAYQYGKCPCRINNDKCYRIMLMAN